MNIAEKNWFAIEINRLETELNKRDKLIRDMRHSMTYMHNVRDDKLAVERMRRIDERIKEIGVFDLMGGEDE